MIFICVFCVILTAIFLVLCFKDLKPMYATIAALFAAMAIVAGVRTNAEESRQKAENLASRQETYKAEVIASNDVYLVILTGKEGYEGIVTVGYRHPDYEAMGNLKGAVVSHGTFYAPWEGASAAICMVRLSLRSDASSWSQDPGDYLHLVVSQS